MFLLVRCARQAVTRAAAPLLLALALTAAHDARAAVLGIDLLVGIDSAPCPQSVCTAEGGADGGSNVPLDLVLAGGEELEVFLRIDLGVPIRQYQTTITTDPASLTFLDATEISTLGFLATADPNDTLAATPELAEADSELCAIGACVAPSTNTFYSLRFSVNPGFTADALRDLTVSVDAVLFDRGEDSLDTARDTASLRLQMVPEPGSSLLLGAGLVVLALRNRRSVR